MSKKPRLSAPIGRVRIKTAEVRKRRASGRWGPAAAPADAERTEADESSEAQSRPRFYPLGSQRTDEAGD